MRSDSGETVDAFRLERLTSSRRWRRPRRPAQGARVQGRRCRDGPRPRAGLAPGLPSLWVVTVALEYRRWRPPNGARDRPRPPIRRPPRAVGASAPRSPRRGSSSVRSALLSSRAMNQGPIDSLFAPGGFSPQNFPDLFYPVAIASLAAARRRRRPLQRPGPPAAPPPAPRGAPGVAAVDRAGGLRAAPRLRDLQVLLHLRARDRRRRPGHVRVDPLRPLPAAHRGATTSRSSGRVR